MRCHWEYTVFCLEITILINKHLENKKENGINGHTKVSQQLKILPVRSKLAMILALLQFFGYPAFSTVSFKDNSKC